jgi:putative effector of murein hydrolase LrgA (UPF0299 family)
MEKTFLRVAPIGMAVAAVLVGYVYYSNLHRNAPRLGEFLYLMLCPPSVLLMLTENASFAGQIFIVTVVVLLNGCLYGAVALILHNLFKRRDV